MSKRKLEPVIVEGNIIPYSQEGKMLGLPITTSGYKKAFLQKRSQCNAILNRLRRFRELSPSNKKKLYTAYVKSVLTYPPVPLNGASKTNQKILQVIQNKALRFIFNVHYQDRITNEAIHMGADMQPINIFLHEQAASIWEKTDLTMTDNMKTWITEDQRHEHHWFRKSRIKALGAPPQPIY